MIRVNVGGVTIKKTREYLSRLQYFESLFRVNGDVKTVDLSDRDPIAFMKILRYLDSPYYEIPKKYEDDVLFYGVKVDDLEDLEEVNECTSLQDSKKIIYIEETVYGRTSVGTPLQDTEKIRIVRAFERVKTVESLTRSSCTVELPTAIRDFYLKISLPPLTRYKYVKNAAYHSIRGVGVYVGKHRVYIIDGYYLLLRDLLNITMTVNNSTLRERNYLSIEGYEERINVLTYLFDNPYIPYIIDLTITVDINPTHCISYSTEDTYNLDRASTLNEFLWSLSYEKLIPLQWTTEPFDPKNYYRYDNVFKLRYSLNDVASLYSRNEGIPKEAKYAIITVNSCTDKNLSDFGCFLYKGKKYGPVESIQVGSTTYSEYTMRHHIPNRLGFRKAPKGVYVINEKIFSTVTINLRRRTIGKATCYIVYEDTLARFM